MGIFLQENLNVVFKCAWSNSQYRAKCDKCPITPTCSQRRIHVHPENPESCWEMALFNILEFGSGDNVPILNAAINKIVVFTTKKPNMDHRSIIGITRINNIRRHETLSCSHGAYWSDIVVGDPTLFVEIPQKIDINYENWDNRLWRQGLFRYLKDDKLMNILVTVKSIFQATGINSSILGRLDELIKSVG